MNGHHHKCPDEQRDALLLFKQNISSVKLNWETSLDCCGWVGITCDNLTGDVISVNLRDGNLQGVSKLNILLSRLPKLATIDLSYSGLSVVTRNDARDVISDLYELRLASCNLTMFPYFLRGMKNLRIIDLSNNYISGHIPAWAGEIGGNNLIYLNLSKNSITSLPQFTTYQLQYLYLQSNLLQGSFPIWICNMKHLKYLDVSSNNINGVVPQCLGNMSSSLESLYISANMIQGPFPTIICNMSGLLYLDMSDNNFHSVIPQCFGNITSSLKLINLGYNNFYGTIPKVYGNCDLSVGLILKVNMLEDEVPRSLAKCQSMKILDLGNNRLNGTFPRWLGYLQKLRILILGSNNLQGTIETPSAIEFLFPSLSIFDISSNGFVGRLPEKYFESFNAIKDVDKEPKTKIVNISGLPSYSINILVKDISIELITIIDLSSNKFEGEIPNVIGNLRSLMVLNLSNNNLNGQIPHVLGNLVNIEALDLSRNQIQGEIPQNLVNLRYLSLLNLSQNRLVGHIPVGPQLQSFSEDSFLGNPGLCGPPLETNCEDLKSPPKVEAKGGERIHVESVMLGLGFGTLLGVGFGYGMLSTGRPKWLNAVVDVGVHTRRKKKKQGHIKRRN
ncbi:hypothetical protein E3N88_27696 [Mikania micrantha]|uniref:Leucine-rich repeat-containing N-terminal plant-type domain-containing protein n=1 Tax=Mikania micrantha TaxID=192012 RepID=A0A5N6N075_9ASTR|nr:hypothetical protein E3N88_27696 [Mikania micrantha]